MTTQFVPTVPEVLAEKYIAAWQHHDPDEIIALHTADTIFTSVATGKAVGRDAVRTAIAETFTVWPDIQFHVRRLYVTPGVIVAESVAQVTQAVRMPLGNVVIEPVGRTVQFAVADILALDGGLVERKDSYIDALGYVRAMQEPSD